MAGPANQSKIMQALMQAFMSRRPGQTPDNNRPSPYRPLESVNRLSSAFFSKRDGESREKKKPARDRRYNALMRRFSRKVV